MAAHRVAASHFSLRTEKCSKCGGVKNLDQCSICGDTCCMSCNQTQSTRLFAFPPSAKKASAQDGRCASCVASDTRLYCLSCGSEEFQPLLQRCYNTPCRNSVHTYCIQACMAVNPWYCPICSQIRKRLDWNHTPANQLYRNTERLRWEHYVASTFTSYSVLLTRVTRSMSDDQDILDRSRIHRVDQLCIANDGGADWEKYAEKFWSRQRATTTRRSFLIKFSSVSLGLLSQHEQLQRSFKLLYQKAQPSFLAGVSFHGSPSTRRKRRRTLQDTEIVKSKKITYMGRAQALEYTTCIHIKEETPALHGASPYTSLSGYLMNIEWGSILQPLWMDLSKATSAFPFDVLCHSFSKKLSRNLNLTRKCRSKNSAKQSHRVMKLQRISWIKGLPHLHKELLHLLGKIAEFIRNGYVRSFAEIRSWHDIEQLDSAYNIWPRADKIRRLYVLAANFSRIDRMLEQISQSFRYRHYYFSPRCINPLKLSIVESRTKRRSISTPDLAALMVHKTFVNYCLCTPLELCESKKAGLYLKAAWSIPAASVVLEYCGVVEPQMFNLTKVSNNSPAIFNLGVAEQASMSTCISAEPYTNLSRFIAHASDPKYINVKAIKWLVDNKLEIYFVSKRRIACGETLFFDYNAGEEQDYPTQNLKAENFTEDELCVLA